MKLIIAYVKPEVLSEVKKGLVAADITKMSVTNALGCGAEPGYHEKYRGADVQIDLLKKVRFEIAVNDEYVERVISTIVEQARTPGPDHHGDLGDGKIFVVQLHECVRIRTGERGHDAIG